MIFRLPRTTEKSQILTFLLGKTSLLAEALFLVFADERTLGHEPLLAGKAKTYSSNVFANAR